MAGRITQINKNSSEPSDAQSAVELLILAWSRFYHNSNSTAHRNRYISESPIHIQCRRNHHDGRHPTGIPDPHCAPL